MSIRADVQQLQAIRAEIKALNDKKRKLREQELAVEGRIAEFLRAKEQQGVKYQGTAIVLEEKETHRNRPPKDRDAEAISVLARYGVPEPEKALSELMQARKGEKIIKQKLKIKKYSGENTI